MYVTDQKTVKNERKRKFFVQTKMFSLNNDNPFFFLFFLVCAEIFINGIDETIDKFFEGGNEREREGKKRKSALLFQGKGREKQNADLPLLPCVDLVVFLLSLSLFQCS